MCGYEDFVFSDWVRANGGTHTDLVTGDVYVNDRRTGKREVVGTLAGCRLCKVCHRHASGEACSVCGGDTFVLGEEYPG